MYTHCQVLFMLTKVSTTMNVIGNPNHNMPMCLQTRANVYYQWSANSVGFWESGRFLPCTESISQSAIDTPAPVIRLQLPSIWSLLIFPADGEGVNCVSTNVFFLVTEPESFDTSSISKFLSHATNQYAAPVTLVDQIGRWRLQQRISCRCYFRISVKLNVRGPCRSITQLSVTSD